MRIMSIDPGTTMSAYTILDGLQVVACGHVPNEEALEIVRRASKTCGHLVLEMIASYGMAVGQEVFETVFWIGRFFEAWGDRPSRHRLFRMAVKMHLCHSAQARDANIRQALIDKYGGGKGVVGTKKNPGPLYGVSGDIWAALGVGVTWCETEGQKHL